MKNFLLTTLFCFICSPAFAWNPYVAGITVEEASSAYLLEHFPSGYDNTWNETVGTNGTITTGATLSGSGWSSDSGTVGMDIAVTTNGTATKTYTDTTIASGATYTVTGEFNLISYTLPNAGDQIDILTYLDSTFSGVITMFIDTSTGSNLRFYIQSNNYSGTTAITTGRHTFELYVDGTTSTNSYIALDGGTHNTFDAKTTQRGRLYVGYGDYLDSDEAIEIEWGHIKIVVE